MARSTVRRKWPSRAGKLTGHMTTRTIPFISRKTTTRTPKSRPAGPAIVIPMPMRAIDARAAHHALVRAFAAGILDAQPEITAAEAYAWAEDMIAEMAELDRPSAAEMAELVRTFNTH
jgi:hypothetical protein